MGLCHAFDELTTARADVTTVVDILLVCDATK